MTIQLSTWEVQSPIIANCTCKKSRPKALLFITLRVLYIILVQAATLNIECLAILGV